jgi:hypothetical protein
MGSSRWIKISPRPSREGIKRRGLNYYLCVTYLVINETHRNGHDQDGLGLSRQIFGPIKPASHKNFVDLDMADVLKSLYRRYIEVSEATRFKPDFMTTMQVRYSITSRFTMTHRPIKALRDVCHVLFTKLINGLKIVPASPSFPQGVERESSGLRTQTGCPIENFGHDRQIEIIIHSIMRLLIYKP